MAQKRRNKYILISTIIVVIIIITIIILIFTVFIKNSDSESDSDSKDQEKTDPINEIDTIPNEEMNKARNAFKQYKYIDTKNNSYI